MRKTDILRQLQDADTRIDSARTAISILESQLGIRDALAAREAEIEQARGELRVLEGQQRDLELQAEDRRAKIATDEGKLYGGKVTSPKELTSLTEEVAQDRRQLSGIEDRLLVILEQVEEITGRITQLEAVHQRELATWRTEQGSATEKLQVAQATLEATEGQRARIASQVPPADLVQYETIRRQKNGTAVAIVQQRTCQSCRVGLTPNQEQRARIGAEIVTCNSCGRILFVALN
jgi:predicted  nucleic acid-binding Zn-ribbon protein